MTEDRETGQFVPLHKGHAIDQVLFALQFEGALDDASIKELRERLAKDSAFPAKNDIRQIGLQVGVGVHGPMVGNLAAASGTPQLVGLQFRKARQDGTVETELRLDKAAFSFRTINYTRWADVWANVKGYIDISLPIYLRSTRLLAVGLTYVDKFIWEGAPGNSNSVSLLRSGSPYIAPHVYSAKDLWHSHSGAFVRVDAKTKRLISVDIDYVDELVTDHPRKALSIQSVLNDILNQPDYESAELTSESTPAFVETHMTQLHDVSKQILADIINSDMARRIALES
jgi:uncharacterized protein (TIGR04255 family)